MLLIIIIKQIQREQGTDMVIVCFFRTNAVLAFDDMPTSQNTESYENISNEHIDTKLPVDKSDSV